MRRFFDEPSRIPPGTSDERRVIHEQLKRDATLTLPDGQSWDDVLVDALAETGRVLRETYGTDMAAWRYGDAHKILWKHNLGRDPEGAALFNVGRNRDGRRRSHAEQRQLDLRSARRPRDIVSADFRPAEPERRAGLHPRQATPAGPGSPHYMDHLERWRDVEYFPLYVEWADIEANAEGTLELRTGG